MALTSGSCHEGGASKRTIYKGRHKVDMLCRQVLEQPSRTRHDLTCQQTGYTHVGDRCNVVSAVVTCAACTPVPPSLLTSSLIVMGMRKAGFVVVTLTRTVAFWERAKEIGPVPGPVLSYAQQKARGQHSAGMGCCQGQSQERSTSPPSAKL